MDAAGSGAGTGSMNAPASVRVVATAKGSVEGGMEDNWEESWDRMKESERRNRDIGEHRQLEGESLVEAARERDYDALLLKERYLVVLHNEFRIAAARLGFVANWLENTYAAGTQDATAARGYANAAKEVLDKGLDWLLEREVAKR